MTIGFALSFGVQTNAAVKDTSKHRVIIVFKDKFAANEQTITNNDGSVKREFRNIPAMTADLSTTAIANLQKNPNVESVEYDKTVKILDNTEKSTNLNSVQIKSQTTDWGHTNTGVSKAWNNGITGQGVKIAVLDTGIEYYHDDLKVAGGTSFVTEYLSDGTTDNSYDDYNGHGTNVAGIIASQNNTIGTVGVAPDSKIYAVKVMDSTGSGDLSDIIAGVDWSITNGMNIDNLSMGAPTGSPAFEAIFQKALSSGVLVMAASGNDNLIDNSGVDYPAKYPEVVAVAATDSNNKVADFSSRGPEVDIAAPGVNILSTYINNQYAYMSGTSMATPYASGIAALWKQAYPDLSVTDLENKIYSSALDIEDVGVDNKTGHGLIQAPDSVENQATPYNMKITTYKTFALYNSPTDSSKTTYVVSPQVLQAYQKENGFIQIQTWLGKLYIKPDAYLEGVPVQKTQKVTLQDSTNLYDLPFDNYKRVETLSPQTVYASNSINGWYAIQTWLGTKYIKPTNAIVTDYKENIRLPYSQELYTQPDSAYKTGATISPQDVVAIDKRGASWYLINTWLGSRWVNAQNPIVGTITETTDKITLSQRVDLYNLPFSTMKTGATISANQTVQAIEKWQNWVLVKTWLGTKWIQQ